MLNTIKGNSQANKVMRLMLRLLCWEQNVNTLAEKGLEKEKKKTRYDLGWKVF